MARRSALTNTECGLIIDSPGLAAEVAQPLQRDRLSGGYRLRSQQAGGKERIEWVAGTGEQEAAHAAGPLASMTFGLQKVLATLLIKEDLL